MPVLRESESVAKLNTNVDTGDIPEKPMKDDPQLLTKESSTPDLITLSQSELKTLLDDWTSNTNTSEISSDITNNNISSTQCQTIEKYDVLCNNLSKLLLCQRRRTVSNSRSSKFQILNLHNALCVIEKRIVTSLLRRYPVKFFGLRKEVGFQNQLQSQQEIGFNTPSICQFDLQKVLDKLEVDLQSRKILSLSSNTATTNSISKCSNFNLRLFRACLSRIVSLYLKLLIFKSSSSNSQSQILNKFSKDIVIFENFYNKWKQQLQCSSSNTGIVSTDSTMDSDSDTESEEEEEEEDDDDEEDSEDEESDANEDTKTKIVKNTSRNNVTSDRQNETTTQILKSTKFLKTRLLRIKSEFNNAQLTSNDSDSHFPEPPHQSLLDLKELFDCEFVMLPLLLVKYIHKYYPGDFKIHLIQSHLLPLVTCMKNHYSQQNSINLQQSTQQQSQNQQFQTQQYQVFLKDLNQLLRFSQNQVLCKKASKSESDIIRSYRDDASGHSIFGWATGVEFWWSLNKGIKDSDFDQNFEFIAHDHPKISETEAQEADPDAKMTTKSYSNEINSGPADNKGSELSDVCGAGTEAKTKTTEGESMDSKETLMLC